MTTVSTNTAVAASGVPEGSLDHIPGEDGWPIVGNTLSALRDLLGNVESMHRKYGPVYRNYMFGYRSIVLLGPEANELVLFDRDKNFSSAAGWAPILERLFPRGLMLMDFEEHRLHRRALGVAFKSSAMKAYLAALNSGIAQRIAGWQQTGSPQSRSHFRFHPAIKQLTLDLASTSFLGIGLGAQSDAINRAFIAMVAAAVGVVRVPLPGTQMGKGVRGRKFIIAFLTGEIPKRRAGDGTDLLSELCRTTKETGELLSDQEIADHLSFLMMAAHDTLTSSITSLVYLLAINPDWQERLRAELSGLGLPPGAGLPYERLGDLPLLDMAFKEAMRINPPVTAIPRRALRDFRFKGHHIPAGTPVSISPLFTHRMPELWPDPERFDPLRFRDEIVRERHKYAFVPYGGGAHMCLGSHFAAMQAKCFFYHLLTTARLSVPCDYVPSWQMWPIPKPRDGLPITLERLTEQLAR